MEKYYKEINEVNCIPFFIYCFSLFESALTESLRHFLYSFPEKLSGEAIKREDGKSSPYFHVSKETLIESLGDTKNILAQIVNEKIRRLSKGNLCSILGYINKYFAIETGIENTNTEKMSKLRNSIVHDSIFADRKYFKAKEKYKIEPKEIQLIEYKNYCNELIEKLKSIAYAISVKYARYTKEKLIRDIWDYVFKSPLLSFDDTLYIDKDEKVLRFNFEHIEKISTSICSGEKFFLAFLLHQYSTSKNDEYFKFCDIPMLASILDRDKLKNIIDIFSIYPHLFNGEKI